MYVLYTYLSMYVCYCILFLQGMVTLVTGGASGLGLATVQRVVREGGRAVICDLPTSKGSVVAERFGPDAVFAPTDVSPSFFVIHSFIYLPSLSLFISYLVLKFILWTVFSSHFYCVLSVLHPPSQVTSPADVENALKLCKEKFGKLDVTVNCAGLGIAIKTYNHNKKVSHSLEDFMKTQTVCFVED